MRTYVAQARKEPQHAQQLLEFAYSIDGHSPTVLGPLAEWRFATGDPAGSIPLFREYVTRVPDDWPARGHFAAASLAAGQIDEAIASLQALLASAPLSDDSRASAVAHLAYAFLCKEDLGQAQALLNTIPLSRAGDLSPGQQQCLYYAGVIRYLSGEQPAALRLIDRLYAINAAFPEALWAKASMRDGTFHLLLPDGQALEPNAPGHAATSPVVCVRVTPMRCATCGAPVIVGESACIYCRDPLQL